MTKFIARRLAAVPLVLLMLTAIMFLLYRISPTDAAKEFLGPRASKAEIAAMNHKLFLDRSLPVQYVHYVYNLVQGDLGVSLRTHRTVISDLRSYLPATVELALFGLVFALILAAILAMLTVVDWPGAGFVRWVLITGASAPVFLLAIVGILLFYSSLHWLPASGETGYFDPPASPTGFLLVDALIAGRTAVFVDALRHIILPALCVSIGPAVSIGRVLRGSLIEALESDYARTARSRGMREITIVFRHGLRN